MNLNKVLLIGNLTRDPEVRTTPNGQTVATVGIATNRVWNNPQTGQKQEQVEFHSVVCWGKLAELAGQYLAKGRTVYIEGRLQTRSWQDKNTNEKKYRTEIVAENMQFGPRPGGAAGASGGAWQPGEAGNASQGGSGAKPGAKKSAPMQEEDLPIIQEDADVEVKDIPF